nr:MAG TPA: hypothetical protein [Caudoviricetes sp.]
MSNAKKIIIFVFRGGERYLLEQFQSYGQQHFIGDFLSHISGSCDARMVRGYRL